MAQTGQIYYCNICGQKVKVLESGAGTLECCGEEMELAEEEE